jgi:hypothetical protein
MLAFTAGLAHGESALLLKETLPGNTPSQSWAWCRVFADRVEITAETDGEKAPLVKRDVRFDGSVKDAAALRALIESADRAVPTKWVTTDSGGVRQTAYRDSQKIILKIRGDEEADNPTDAAKTLVQFIDRNCAVAEEADAAFPDYLSLSCNFQSPNGSEGFQFKPADGAAQAGSNGTYVARCEPLKGARAACSIIEARPGAAESVLARKVFDPAGGAGITVEAEPSLRLVCRANS